VKKCVLHTEAMTTFTVLKSQSWKKRFFCAEAVKKICTGFFMFCRRPEVVACGVVTEVVGENTFAAIKWWARKEHGPYLSPEADTIGYIAKE
jgi:hypothetical protein